MNLKDLLGQLDAHASRKKGKRKLKDSEEKRSSDVGYFKKQKRLKTYEVDGDISM